MYPSSIDRSITLSFVRVIIFVRQGLHTFVTLAIGVVNGPLAGKDVTFALEDDGLHAALRE
jgi:hypothetical protein